MLSTMKRKNSKSFEFEGVCVWKLTISILRGYFTSEVKLDVPVTEHVWSCHE
jgi:hypothetical protein